MFSLILFALLAAPQDAPAPAKNPLAGDAAAINAAIRAGAVNFRLNCSFCHGGDARGGSRGPDLAAGRRSQGDSDAAMFRIITKGIPGTEMPGNDLREEEVWQLVSFVRSLNVPAAPIAGNREAGEKLFFGASTCSQCHMVGGRGGRLGPALSRIGATRSLRHLTESVREAAREITPRYDTVVVVTRDGKRITGARKNEDTFSIQMMDEKEELRSFLKRDLKEVISEKRSLMPDYGPGVLNDKDLQNLLAYLDSLRGN